jgi:hypothetical protein
MTVRVSSTSQKVAIFSCLFDKTFATFGTQRYPMNSAPIDVFPFRNREWCRWRKYVTDFWSYLCKWRVLRDHLVRVFELFLVGLNFGEDKERSKEQEARNGEYDKEDKLHSEVII